MGEGIVGVMLREAMSVTGVEELVMLLTSALETCPRMSKWVLGKHHSAHIAEEAEAAHAVDLSFSSSSSGPLLI